MAKRVRKRLTSPREVRAPAVVQMDPRQLEMLVAQIRGETKDKPTFKTLADAWLAANSARLVAPENEWRHIRHLKALWTMKEGELTPTGIVQALSALVDISAHTLNKIRSTGRRVIHSAMGDGKWGAVNPFALVKPFKQTRPKFRTLSLDEIFRILPHLREDRRRLVRVMLLLGTRPGELLGLKKEDVDLDNGKLLIRRSHYRATTKTGEWREVPIPELVLEDIRAAMDESPSAYVFPRKDGRRQRQDTKLAQTLRTAMGKAGIVSHYRYSCRRKGCGFKEDRTAPAEAWCPVCNFKLWIQPVPQRARFYDLRHSAATLHRQAGADPLAIKLTLGHARRDPTDDVYTHLTCDDVRREMNKLELTQGKQMNATEQSGTSLGSLRSTTELPPLNNWQGVQPRPLLTVKDVGVRLSLKKSAVYRLVSKRLLSVIRVGGLIRFRAEDVEAFVAGRLQ